MTLKSKFPVQKKSLSLRLVKYSRGDATDLALASMLVSAKSGESVLGGWMGLTAPHFKDLMRRHFPGLKPPLGVRKKTQRMTLRSLEWEDLQKLLLSHRAGHRITERYIADIVCSACLGLDHLWQDLGLLNRHQLSLLMEQNFPTLAQQNNKGMKWKKFLYKQLCNSKGAYVCRAPSCEECLEYDICFGPEDE